MAVECDPEKRRLTLEHRGLDMARAEEIFDGATLTITDDRKDYGEERFITIGFLETGWWSRSGPSVVCESA